MTLDPQKISIRLKDDDPDGEMFALDTAVFLLNVLRDLSLTKDASTCVKNDAKVIFDWLGQDVSELSEESVRKFKLGYLAYLSIGVAPTFQQQPVFDKFKAHPNSKARAQYKPPAEVMDVFDRMNATDAEILEKRKYDESVDLERLKKTFEILKQPKSITQSLIARINGLSEKTKIFIVLSFLWCVWVNARTATSFQLVGYYFDQWDDDMFIQNLLLVPASILIGNFIYNKYLKDKK